MTTLFRRTCRDIGNHDPRFHSEPPSRPVEDWKDEAAYVLLGAPGSGKTTIFRQQAERQGGHYVTARDFLAFDNRPEWQQTPLFIDGLDETRAGSTDGRAPMDGIRVKLDRLGCPRFRLSCREADWFGTNDRSNLEKVAPGGTVKVLRIDPLTDREIHDFLREVLGNRDPDRFLVEARGMGLQGLLVNPQSLTMLAAAVGADGIWPETRSQTFDMACRALLAERNDEHRLAGTDPADNAGKVKASGMLLAVQLLTGAAGFALPGSEGDQHFIELDQLPGASQELLRCCLQSRLFEASAECRMVPVHRQVAEFLAARHLAALVEDGLPVGRIIALITGYDGAVVSELRGLAAWLAALSKPGRAEVIASDPLGAALYGDAKHFSPKEKIQILAGIEQQVAANPRLITMVELDARLGDLVTGSMECRIRKILAEPAREDSWQSYIAILLEALHHGEQLPKLADSLMALIRDGTRWPRIRDRAVDVFMRHHHDDIEALAELKALADEIHSGRVTDPDDGLLGRLLSTLYPKAISAAQIMQYLRVPKKPGNILGYEFFWIRHLPGKSNRDQLAKLLDELVECYPSLVSGDREPGFSTIPVSLLPSTLLARYLRLSGNDVDPARLFIWLETIAISGDRTYGPDIDSQELKEICNWLASRPAVWKSLLEMCLLHCSLQPGCSEARQFQICMGQEERGRLLGITRPPDFGVWCLDQAVAAGSRVIAEWFVAQVADCLHFSRWDAGLSRKAVSGRLAGSAGLKDVSDSRMIELEALSANNDISKSRLQERPRTRRSDWHVHVKPFEGELRAGRVRPALLHQLATAYFGGYLDIRGNSPRDRLNALLANDENLVDAVLSGFRNTLVRDDLPSIASVMRLGRKNRIHHLALPFMAGMEELANASPSGRLNLDHRNLRLALAIHYTVPIWPTARQPADRPPPWFAWALSSHPGTAADVLVRTALSKLRKGEESPAGIRKLAHSPDHARVAHLASMPLLEQFPVRCASGQLRSLDHLLSAARRHCDIDPLLELIDERHDDRRMSVAQRIHWLVAGLCIAPESYVELLEKDVEGKERRVRFLANAVTGQFGKSPGPNCNRSVPALRLLIRLIGSSFRPCSLDADSDSGLVMVTPEFNAAERVRNLIEHLAAISTEEASRALDALSSDNRLRAWNSLLVKAVHRQREVRREAAFAYRDVAQVLATLDCGAPANVADLAALTYDHLRQVAHDIRAGNTSGWRQFWNVDHHRRPINPRPEDVCRDALVPILQERLRGLGIDVQPEGRYANERRADIRVSCPGFNIPVEIRRSCSRDLWSALQSQMIAHYSIDPKTGGHGIYLVFWFGDTRTCRPRPPETGPPVADPCDLEDRLQASMPAGKRHGIRICVIDVSEPASR